MFGLGWGELLIVLIAIAVVWGLFFSAPVRRRLTDSGLSSRLPGAPAADPLLPIDPLLTTAPPPASPAEAILAERFARGELTDAEFEAKRKLIRQGEPE